MDGLADYAQSTEHTRKALLKPRKATKSMPGSAEYIPMLLTLALARDGLETYVDDDDNKSTDTEDSSDTRHSSDCEEKHAIVAIARIAKMRDSSHSSDSEDSEERGG